MSTPAFNVAEGTHYFDCDIPKLPLTGGSYRVSLWCGINGVGTDHLENKIKLDVIDDDYFQYGREISANLKGKVVFDEHVWHKSE